jgi:uncharacterized protein with HEPN domain
MERDTNTYLYDIIQSCPNIRQFTTDIDFQTYTANLLIKSAVERQFIIIGEGLNRINRFDPVMYNHIPHAERIIGFRNIIVHGYDIVSDQLVWQIVQSHLSELVEVCNQLLGRL